MRIGIDCRLSGLAHAGIGRYIENLIRRLPVQAPEVQWIYFFHDQQQARTSLETLNFSDNVRVRSIPISHYTIAEQLRLPHIFSAEKLDLLHVPHFNVPIFYRGKMVVTIHDLLWHEQRGSNVTTLRPWEYWAKYIGYKTVAQRAVHKAKHILVPAQTIKQTLINYYPTISDKITVTHEGVDDRLLKFNLDNTSKRRQNTLLYVGSLYPHKNITVVLNALTKLPNWSLLIVGSRNVFQDQVKATVDELNIDNQVEFAGFLSDEELADRIQSVTALIQPSLSEGFGLTGLEALALKTPVIASNIPIFKEIYQDAAFYFDPNSSASFIKTLTKLPTFNSKKAAQIVQMYNWNRTVEQTLSVYRSVI